MSEAPLQKGVLLNPSRKRGVRKGIVLKPWVVIFGRLCHIFESQLASGPVDVVNFT